MPIFGDPDDIPAQPEGYNEDDYDFSELGFITAKYVWNAWGDNCAICDSMNGRVYTLDYWMNVGIWPGFHLNCDCTMKRVSATVPTSDPDFFGTAIPQYIGMYTPRANIVWDTGYIIEPWQNSIVKRIEQMHLDSGTDTPFSELISRLKGTGIFSHAYQTPGNTAGWRTLATQRHYQNIDGHYSGSKFFTPGNISYILEPLWRWLESKWKTKSVYDPEKKFSSMPSQSARIYDPNKKYAQMSRIDTPIIQHQPQSLRPRKPYQTHFSAIDNVDKGDLDNDSSTYDRGWGR